jgi:hypothetical protein
MWDPFMLFLANIIIYFLKSLLLKFIHTINMNKQKNSNSQLLYMDYGVQYL